MYENEDNFLVQCESEEYYSYKGKRRVYSNETDENEINYQFESINAMLTSKEDRHY